MFVSTFKSQLAVGPIRNVFFCCIRLLHKQWWGILQHLMQQKVKLLKLFNSQQLHFTVLMYPCPEGSGLRRITHFLVVASRFKCVLVSGLWHRMELLWVGWLHLADCHQSGPRVRSDSEAIWQEREGRYWIKEVWVYFSVSMCALLYRCGGVHSLFAAK